jgi:hypothetical protein
LQSINFGLNAQIQGDNLMRDTKIEQAGRFCAILLTAMLALQSADAAQPTPATDPQPDVKKTSKQLEEVMKLLQQGAKEDGGGMGAESRQDKKASAKTVPPAPTPAAKP